LHSDPTKGKASFWKEVEGIEEKKKKRERKKRNATGVRYTQNKACN
jgi:hypothetical protein